MDQRKLCNPLSNLFSHKLHSMVYISPFLAFVAFTIAINEFRQSHQRKKVIGDGYSGKSIRCIATVQRTTDLLRTIVELS